MTSRVKKTKTKKQGPTAVERVSEEHSWLANLSRELFQTEQSARRHPRVEVERLGDVPPARVLRGVAGHADEALAELPELMKQYDLPVSLGGISVGSAFSILRDRLADLMLSAERSYRATLLGMRHGVDLVVLLEQVARRDGATALADWCVVWLERRRELLDDAERALEWFAAHPERAQQAATRGPLARGFHALVEGFERVADRRRRATASVASS
jgi:hypothetical protein